MNEVYILDTGPILNFLSTDNTRTLIASLGSSFFYVPAAVRDEVTRKAKPNSRFVKARQEWLKLLPNWIKIIPEPVFDDQGINALAAELFSKTLTRLPSLEKDLGEAYVVLHALEMAILGDHVFVVIDDEGGQEVFAEAKKILNKRRVRGEVVGEIELLTTTTLLASLANSSIMNNREIMRKTYGKMRLVDDGLYPIERTNLLSKEIWATKE